MVVDFYNEVFNKHNIDIIPKYVSEDYKQHNPFVADGRKSLHGFLLRRILLKILIPLQRLNV